MEIIPNRK